MWSTAAQQNPMDHNTPLADVSFHDVSGLGLGQDGSHDDGDIDEAKSIQEGGDYRDVPRCGRGGYSGRVHE